MNGLAFAHPGFLWGLGAVALPIFIHLFNRRRPRPLPFGAIDFVLRSQRQKSRRLRLRQLLLLALRCLLIGAIALALARPSLRPRDAAVANRSGPQATVLLLDASLSMRYRLGSVTLFDRARSEALAALDRLTVDEPASVGLCAGNGGIAGGPLGAPSFDRAAARAALRGAQPTYQGSDLTNCLSAAARALGESPLAGKRIFVFGDLAAHSLRPGAPLPLIPVAGGAPVRPNVVFVDAAQGHALANLAVTAVEVRPAPALGPRGYEIIATVANHSDRAVSGAAVSLLLGGQVTAKGFVDVPARGVSRKTLGAALPAGLAVGRVEVQREDAQGLDEDDGRDFLVQVPRDLRVLVVDGSPSSLRTRDEAFFVEAALAPARTGGRVAVQVRDADAAAGAPLEGYEVVLLLNVPAPTRAFVERLREAVQVRGVGLFVALGDHVDPDAYNDVLGDLLPRPLHLIKTAGGADNAAGPSAARFGLIDWSHPLFRIFSGADREGLESARTSRYALLRPEGTRARTLASYDDGAPALVEGRVGAGRVLLYTSTVSRSWSDWPLRSSFLPVLQQAVTYLAGALEEKEQRPALVGGEQRIAQPQGTRVVGALGPDGSPVPVRLEAPLAGPGRPQAAATVGAGAASATGAAGAANAVLGEVAAGPLALPGVYRVQIAAAAGGPARDEPVLSFVAGVDPRESDLRRADEAELAALLGGGGAAQVADSAQAAAGDTGTPLWGALLLLAALALVGEGALTRR